MFLSPANCLVQSRLEATAISNLVVCYSFVLYILFEVLCFCSAINLRRECLCHLDECV